MSEKKEFKLPKNHVGYISKSQSGLILLTIEQDLVLKKGDKLIQKKPAEAIDGLVEKEFITEEEGEKRKARIPDWKLYEVTKLPSRE